MSHSDQYNRVIKAGNSLVVVVPAPFVKMTGVQPGDQVKATYDAAKGTLTYQLHQMRQLPLV